MSDMFQNQLEDPVVQAWGACTTVFISAIKVVLGGPNIVSGGTQYEKFKKH